VGKCYNHPPKKGGISVTVCVAAICEENSFVLGASDRMLTAGDIQFEPQQSKLFFLTTSMIAMLAGDSALQTEILNEVRKIVDDRIAAQPDNWWDVKEVAELYIDFYNKARLKQGQNEILAPLGLDADTFISRQKQMDSALVRQLATELINVDIAGTSTIFAGIDKTGPHIYVAHGSDLSCLDSVGFASVGVGAWHANSQLMLSGHTRWDPFHKALISVYSAKKRSEVAPGVGEDTDMFMLGSSLGSYRQINPEIIGGLDKIYQKAIKQQHRAIESSEKSTKDYVEKILREAAKEQDQPQETKDDRRNPPSDEGDVRDDTEEGGQEG